jgi:hypothetical protein
VVSFRTTQSEDPFLQKGVTPIPEGECKTQALRSIAKPGKTILVPPTGARARLFVWEILPDLAIGTVVLTHRTPRALAEIWANRLPAARRIRRRIFKPRVLRGHWRALFHISHGYAAFCNIALAVVTTLSTVNPNSFCRAFSGAEPPNVCMPMTRPVEPT